MKDVTTYKKLIYEINKLGTDTEKMQLISEYILNNVKYDYLYTDNKIIDKYCAKYGDEVIFKGDEDLIDPKAKEKVVEEKLGKLYNLCDKLWLSTTYRLKLNNNCERKLEEISNGQKYYENKLKEIYNKKMDEEEKAELIAIYKNKLDEINEKFNLFDILPGMNFSVVKNGLLQKGISSDIAKFVKSLCDDSYIPCKLVNTIENPDHVWNEVEIDGKKLNFDLTYAIFTRDALNDVSENKQSDMDWISNMRISASSWLGFTDEDEIVSTLNFVKSNVDSKYDRAVEENIKAISK